MVDELTKNELLDETSIENTELEIDEESNDIGLDYDNLGPDFKMDSLSLFLKDLSYYPIYNNEKRRAELVKISEGDYSNLDNFLLANIPLVMSVAKRYRVFAEPTWEILDLVQEGFIGLREATLRYNPYNEQGASFATYAYFWIEQKIRRFISENNNTIRVPVHRLEKYRALNKKIDAGMSVEEACELSGLNTSDYYKIYSIVYMNSLNASVMDGDGENLNEMISLIHDTTVDIEESYKTKEMYNEFYELMKLKLNEREFEVVARRIGLFGFEPETLETIGATFGLTRERIRQIEKKALLKLQVPMKRYLSAD